MKLTPTKNPDKVLGCIGGEGLMKRCSVGMTLNKEMLKDFVMKSQAVFLLVEDNEKNVGFVMFNPEKHGAYSVHLCLRTTGKKTEKAFGLSLHYAKFVLGAYQIDAVYPASYRGCERLSKIFSFKPDATLKSYYKLPTGVEWQLKKLFLS